MGGTVSRYFVKNGGGVALVCSVFAVVRSACAFLRPRLSWLLSVCVSRKLHLFCLQRLGGFYSTMQTALTVHLAYVLCSMTLALGAHGAHGAKVCARRAPQKRRVEAVEAVELSAALVPAEPVQRPGAPELPRRGN